MSSLYISNLNKHAPLNGQVQKSRQIHGLFSECHRDFLTIDTSELSPWNFSIFKLAFQLYKADALYLCLGARGLPSILFLASIFCNKSTKIYCFVVGGWLADKINKSNIFKILCKRAHIFLVESERLGEELQDLGFYAEVFYNFRRHSITQKLNFNLNHRQIKLCFCSRVREDKGVYFAIKLVDKLNALRIDASLSIYGPKENSEKVEIEKSIEKSKFTEFKGSIDNDQIIEVFKKYDFLIFPTFYKGECQPGVIVESLAAGTPIISSKWRFMEEYISSDLGRTFLLDQFVNKSVSFISKISNKEYLKMSLNCQRTFKEKYSEEAVEKIFLDLINKK